jgi:endogenous inhibitor of DNA gyrase (YacG/DUF329 family)
MFEKLKEIYLFGKTSKLVNLKYKEELNYLFDKTSKLDEQTKNTNGYKISISQRIYHLLNNIEEIPICKICNNLVTFTGYRTYRIYCCNKCKTSDVNYANRSLKRMTTKLERYGSSNYNNMEKTKSTKLARYGDENFMNLEKGKLTKLERYGDENYSNWKKGKETCLNRYGIKSNLWIKEVREKIITSNIEKYGVSHHAQQPNFEQKFNNKKYTLPSGKIITIQGYENLALDILFKTYNEQDIVIGKHNIFEQLGPIEYNYNEKQHRYYTDFYIKSKNLVIEVKSDWTYKMKEEINLLKKQACLDKNLKFQFWIFSNNKQLNII